MLRTVRVLWHGEFVFSVPFKEAIRIQYHVSAVAIPFCVWQRQVHYIQAVVAACAAKKVRDPLQARLGAFFCGDRGELGAILVSDVEEGVPKTA